MNNTNQHTPLFLQEIITQVQQRAITKVIDATFGEGGHGISIAKLGINVLGIERDEEMFKVGQTKIEQANLSNVILILDNYSNLQRIARKHFSDKVGAIILDLGLSMYQLRHSQRGFSDQRQGNLDLRLSVTQPITAANWLNCTEKTTLEDLLTRYLESPYSHAVVDRILAYRRHRKISTVNNLRELINSIGLDKKVAQSLLRQTLQALRIIVNHEFEALVKAMSQALTILAEGGLLIVLTYHSLEDRVVKQFAKKNQDKLKMVGKAKQNKDYQFAKSGKLRVYEKITV